MIKKLLSFFLLSWSLISNAQVCAPTSNCTADDEILNVTFNTINNSSVCGTGYSDFSSSVSTNLARTISYPISVSVGPGGTEYVAVWIDYDQNGTFDASEYTFIGSGNGVTLNGNITIPPTALLGATKMRVRVRYNTTLLGTDACTTYTYGETEDYGVTIDPAPACTNPPLAGSISGIDSICPSTAFSLTLTGQTLGTELQWQSSSNGVSWVDIAGANLSTLSVTGISANTYYRAAVKCTDTVYTAAKIVSVKSFLQCYCTSNLGGSCGGNDITNVNATPSVFNNSGTGCNTIVGVGAYTAFAPIGTATDTFRRGISYTFNITMSGTSISSVWIDFNQNGVYEASEWAQLSTSTTFGTATITIPNGALLGQTGIRFRSRASGNLNGSTDACSNFGSGETEDYIITIGAAPACTLPISTGTISGNTAVCAGVNQTYTLTGFSLGTSLQWQSSTDNISWTDIVGEVNSSYSTSFSAVSYLRVKVKCISDSAYSNVMSITINAPSTCYCIPTYTTGTTDGDYLEGVQLNNINNNPSGAAATPFYTNYTLTDTTTLYRDSVYTITLTNGQFTGTLAAWLDFNANGIFETSEKLGETAGVAVGATTTFNFTVPSVATLGWTRLRVREVYSSTNVDPCASYGYGETEDYGINISTLAFTCNLVGTVDTAINVSCFGGSNGSITLNVSGGTAPFTHSWSNGATTQDLTGLSAGTYTDTIRDANACMSIVGPISITEPAALISTFDSIVFVKCNGGSSGGIYITMAGGTAPYTYSWSNGATSEDLVNIPAGSYTGTVTDANGCSLSLPAPITILEPTALMPIFDSTVNVKCHGGSTGGIYITMAGGRAPYTYSWSNGATSEDLVNIPAGSYTGTVTDANGCSLSTPMPIVITEPASLMITPDSLVNVKCNGGNTGGVYISVTGGTSPYTYLWSNGASTQDLTNVSAGTYTGTITEANGCSQLITPTPVTVSEPAALMPMVDSIVNVKCHGGSTGGIYITMMGGTAPYTYAWSNGATTSNLVNVPAGSYTGTVTDANGCTLSTPSPIAITEPVAALAAVVDSSKNSACGSATTGAIYTSVSGGTTAYSFAWSNGATTQNLSNVGAGSYSLTVTDANSCSVSTAFVTITAPSTLSITKDSSSNVKCFGGLTGAAYVSVTGGSAAYTYSWTNGASSQDLTALSAGTYNVVVTDANGCSATLSSPFIISQPTAIVSSAVTTPEYASGQKGSIDVTVSGGSGSYTYLWTNAATTQDISGLAQGVYALTITDANGCTNLRSDTVHFVNNIGINEADNQWNVEVYPNPVVNKAYFQITLANEELFNLAIYAANGQVVYTSNQIKAKETLLTVDFSNHAAGVYIAKLILNDKVMTKRLIVNK